ncbi:unnamed protein product [Amoebophrya sp. A120]|nr:unnamed protein product [Amoebophrya sp. A120]|eukprot:GSA120T00000938001.1
MEAELARHASSAAEAEREALNYDERGDYTRAVHHWDLSLQHLSLAEATAVSSNHADVDAIRQHQREVRSRIDHLNSLPPGVPPVPAKDMVGGLQLTSVAYNLETASTASSSGTGGDKKVIGTKAGAALVGATAGLVLLGPISAVALGGAAVYACTRKDKVGDAAKTIGKATSTTINKAVSVDQKHQISTRAAEIGKKTASEAMRLGKQAAESDTGKAVARNTVSGANAVSKWYNKNFGAGASSSSSSSGAGAPGSSSNDGGFPQARNTM